MAEYMTVKNNIITGIYCGMAEEGSITLPDNHEVRVGEPLTFYNSDYTRKSDIQLMQEKLIEVPKGYKIENNNLIEMTYNEKIIAGLEELPHGMKIENNQVIPMTEEEKLAEMSTEEKSQYHRQKRDMLLNSVLWQVERHAQEKILGIATTLSNEQYISLLNYIQELRKLPQQEDFPDNVIYPKL